MKIKLLLIALTACGLLLASAPVLAQDAGQPDTTQDAGPATGKTLPNVEENPGSAIQEAAKAAMSGEWLWATAIVISFLVWGLRTYGKKWVKWFGTKAGGYVLAGSMASLSALALALASGDVGLKMLGIAATAFLAGSGVWETQSDSKAAA